MRDWNTDVAFITGGGQGIGLGIARALAKRGVRLALADIDEQALRRAEDELGDVETVRLDVRDRAAYAEAADRVEAKLGHVSLLFNNAGIAPHAPAATLEYEQWDMALGINIGGVVNGLQTFLPRMIERGTGGHIVNTASGAGLVAGPNVLYTTTKYAIVGLSESLQQAVSEHGIDVSVLCPGAVDTAILRNTISAGFTTTTPAAAIEQSEAFLGSGVSIDSAGESVVAGMEARALWIHTDGSMLPWVKLRMEALLASIPV